MVTNVASPKKSVHSIQCKCNNAMHMIVCCVSKHAACDNPAGTHLNLCAILSQLGRYPPHTHTQQSIAYLTDYSTPRHPKPHACRHKEAIEHAQCALELLKQLPQSEGQGEGNNNNKQGEEQDKEQEKGQDKDKEEVGSSEGSGNKKQTSIIAIAHYNLAVEQVHRAILCRTHAHTHSLTHTHTHTLFSTAHNSSLLLFHSLPSLTPPPLPFRRST